MLARESRKHQIRYVFFFYFQLLRKEFHFLLILTHQLQIAFENIVGKEEIARIEQFLLFPQCFLLNQIIVCPFVRIFDIIFFFFLLLLLLFKVPIAPIKNDLCLQNTSKSHSHHLKIWHFL